MAIRVLLQKTRASYVPWFNFGGPFFDEKSDFQIANFRFFRILAEIADFSKYSENYNFSGRDLCFLILNLDNPFKTNI